MIHVLFFVLAILAAAPATVHSVDGKPEQQSLEILPDTDGVQRATVILDSYSYSPNHLIVQKGKPVELTLHSVTFLTPHNFILKEPAAGLSVDEDTPAGKDKIVRFTPTQPGTYPFYCDKKLLFFKSHRDKGMEGLLEVR
jgi:plastocyanin